jgi:hypothetical protein
MSQVWVPALPQACVSFGSQVPSPEHADHADHVPLSQERLWVPQRPQLSETGPAQD